VSVCRYCAVATIVIGEHCAFRDTDSDDLTGADASDAPDAPDALDVPDIPEALATLER